MSYYFQVRINVQLKKDTPVEVISFIRDCIQKPEERPEPTWDHPFFGCQRWDCIFHQSAFQKDGPFIKGSDPAKPYQLQIHADINYGLDEILEFVKWISPFIHGRKKKKYIGWYKGEDSSTGKINLYRENIFS